MVTLLQTSHRSPLGRLLDQVRRDAVASGLPAATALWIAALPVIGGFLVAITYVRWDLFIWILREDHPVEWVQFALCAITATVALMTAVRYARRGQGLTAIAFLLLGLGAFLLGGEEISWAQRALSFATPAELATKNDQAEFNVHNLTEAGFDISQIFKVVELMIGLGGMLLPFLTRLHPPRLRAPLFVALSPPLFLVPAFAFAFAYRSFRFALTAVGRESDAAIAYTEWAEVCLYGGLAALAIFAYAATRHRVKGRHVQRDAFGQPLPSLPFYGSVNVVLGVVFVLTLVLAYLTMRSGILPGNVQ